MLVMLLFLLPYESEKFTHSLKNHSAKTLTLILKIPNLFPNLDSPSLIFLGFRSQQVPMLPSLPFLELVPIKQTLNCDQGINALAASFLDFHNSLDGLLPSLLFLRINNQLCCAQ